MQAWRLWNDGAALILIDPNLGGNYLVLEVTRCIHIGLLCVQEDASRRPTTASILSMLISHSVILPSLTAPPTFPYRSSIPQALTESNALSKEEVFTNVRGSVQKRYLNFLLSNFYYKVVTATTAAAGQAQPVYKKSQSTPRRYGFGCALGAPQCAWVRLDEVRHTYEKWEKILGKKGGALFAFSEWKAIRDISATILLIASPLRRFEPRCRAPIYSSIASPERKLKQERSPLGLKKLDV
ncbi:putative cysteine-rich receptor-like protein kinase 20 [Bienertia sinuspersici]